MRRGTAPRRLAAVLVVMCLVFGALIVRLVDVQALQAGRFAAYGLSERLHEVTLPADRGAILDRSGNVLAMSVPLTTIFADPKLVTDPAAEAAQLAPVLGADPADLQRKLSQSSRFVYLAHTVPDDVARRVKAMKLPGVAYLEEPKRFLPDGDLGLSVLGTVGYDGKGQSGVEYQYDSRLAGRPGKLVVQEGIGGQAIPGTPEERQPSQPGTGLQLTIDRGLQYETEQALAKQIVASHAHGGTAVVMDSHTGEILAIANLVASDKPGQPVAPASSDLAVTSVYEPGSVMKGVTLSAALQDGVVQPADHFRVPASTVYNGSTIHDAEDHPVEWWTVPDILSYSSNVGTLQISEKLGAQRIYHYMREFGLGSRTALNAPGESAGLVPPPSRWSGTSIATMPIGQGVATTPMQVLDVYNTIANGGVFVPPRLVKGWVDGSGTVHPAAAAPGRTVLSGQTARRMTAMLEDVVKVGTGMAANVPGYDVAGKTGTSQKPSSRGGYQPGAYMATFAGFVPAENPAITAIVVLDQPTPVYYGGLVAAPVFADIAQYALRVLHVPPPPSRNLAPDVPTVDASAAAGGDGPLPAPPPGTATAQPKSDSPPPAGAPPPAGSSGPPGQTAPARAPTTSTTVQRVTTQRSGASTTTTTLARSATPPKKP